MKKILSLFVLLAFFITTNCYAYDTITIGADGQARYEDEEDNYVNDIYSKTNSNNVIIIPENYTYNVQNVQNTTNPVYQAQISKFGKGDTLNVFIQDEISTKDAMSGQEIIAVLSNDWIVNGKVVAESGSVVYGNIVNSEAAKGWSKDAKLQMDFKRIETPNGEIYNITAEKIDIEVEKEKSGWAKAAAIGVGVLAIGALIGASIAYGASGSKTTTTTTTTSNTTTSSTTTTKSDNAGKNSAIGAGIGAAIAVGCGLFVAAQTKGDDITIPSGTNIDLVLTEHVTKQP